MSDIADILDRAADLIEPEGKWCQGVLGKTGDGVPVILKNIERAATLCMAGAIWRAADGNEPSAMEAFKVLRPVLGNHGVGTWNDRRHRSQKTAVAKLREAAAKARGEQS